MRYVVSKIQIEEWLTDAELAERLKASDTRNEYERLLAIRILRMGFSIRDVSTMLNLSETTIQRWIKSYNNAGIQGLMPGKRGGRRRSLLTLDEEKNMLRQWSLRANCNAKELRQMVIEYCRQPVSLKYIYDLIRRHESRPSD